MYIINMNIELFNYLNTYTLTDIGDIITPKI